MALSRDKKQNKRLTSSKTIGFHSSNTHFCEKTLKTCAFNTRKKGRTRQPPGPPRHCLTDSKIQP
jgi:hypothetical protein